MFKTPAFIIDQASLENKCQKLSKLAKENNIKLLYSVKAMSFLPILESLLPYVDGFATSSLFEAKLAQILKKEIHNFSVAYPAEDFSSIQAICQHLSFNSLQQLSALRSQKNVNTQWGLRINPELSSPAIDERYDPCHKNSKLGVPLSLLKQLSPFTTEILQPITGLHLHTTCECEDFTYFHQLIQKIHQEIPHLLQRVKWINLGGGYLFEKANQDLFLQAIKLLQSHYQLQIIIEPGTNFVQDHIFLKSKILDLLPGDDQRTPIAILDTTINHLPEAFEYQDPPDILEGTYPDQEPYTYLLAGLSCLAGDVFGEYGFNRPLKIGDMITFTGIGAYSLVKANRFNGINLPSIYQHIKRGAEDHFLQLRDYSFEEYAAANQPMDC